MMKTILPFGTMGAALALLASCSAYPAMEPDEAEPAGESTVSQALTETSTGTVAQGQWRHFGPFTAASGTFSAAMTGNGDADLYVRRGSQPTSSSYDCRPYAKGSIESCSIALGATTDVYVSVYGYASGTSSFNLTFTYEKPTSSKLVYTVYESGTVSASEWTHYFYNAPAGEFQVEMTGDGDADLYVRSGAQPTMTSYDCRPYSPGTSETCTLALSAPSLVYVSVRGYAASSNYGLAVTRPRTIILPW